jgi:tetratricopeptide (TPR) repeat protein
VDVDIDEPEPLPRPERDSYAPPPRVVADVAAFRTGREPSAPSWEAPSVVAMWPSMESLSTPPPPAPGRTPVDARAAYVEEPVEAPYAEPPAEEAPYALEARYADAADAPYTEGDDAAHAYDVDPPAPEPDVPLGATADLADDPARLLESLRERGIFEADDDASPVPVWTQASEVPRTGTRLGRTLLGVWLGSLLLLGAGYLGWQQWIAHRHGAAAELVAEAKAAAFESDHARLVDAERLLRQARDNHPRSRQVPTGELFVHAQRVLENGSRDLSSLRAAVNRAERLGADAAHLSVARAVLAVYSGAPGEAQALLAKAIPAAKGEPMLLYVVGRLQQRLGAAEQAGAHLRAAAAAAPDLIAASLALAELHHERREPQEALARLDAVLQQRPRHLRAQLWRAFLTADEQDPSQALRAIDAHTKHAREGAAVDRILWALSRARVLRRSGQHDKAGEALREAAAAGASEPRMLALVATDARRAGQLGVAQQAASQALAAAPESTAYRALLASILLERSDGERALRLLAELPQDEPALIAMRARAALLTGDEQALRAALQAIEASSDAKTADGERAALRLRVRAALEPKADLLQEARALLRRAPADPDALRATGEVALALREPDEAVRAFNQLAKLMAQDAEAHYLLGRAQRMAADAKGAEKALRRALELSPGYVGALSALGGLLLDSGKYEEADALYQQLSAHDALQGRLGRAEALIALGRLDDAQVQVSGVPEAQRQSAPARETAARLALAQRKPGEALSLLRPLIEGEGRKAAALALYGDALYAADQVNTAAGAYDSALEIDSALPEALLGRANVHLRAERAGDALDLLERARSALESRLRAPEVRARMLALLGHAYVQREKRGDADRARDALRQAVRLPNPPAEAYFFLGESLGGKRTTEAADAFKRYLELAPQGDYADRARRALGPLL